MFLIRRAKELIGKLPKIKIEPRTVQRPPIQKTRVTTTPFQESQWLSSYYSLMSKRDAAKFPEVSIDGQPINIYRLFLCVTDKGGYKSVDRWDIIAMILDVQVGPERLRAFYENHLLPYELTKNFNTNSNEIKEK